MAGSGAALPRANSALAQAQTLANGLASKTPGADGAAHVASYDGVGGSLWSTIGGFVSALLGGQVASTLPTRAQMVANKVPAAVTTILTSGFASPGDFGGATFVRAPGPFSDGASFQSADGAWWQFTAIEANPAHFGAFGQANPNLTLQDDTIGLQNWINYLKANACAGYIPARTYRHTLSLNWGKASPFDSKQLIVRGSAVGYSRFVSDLSESWPAHDFTNQIDGALTNVYLTSTATSKHTCLCLFAETVADGMNRFRAEKWVLTDFGTSSKYGVFGFCADQFFFNQSQVTTLNPTALAAVFFSNKNPAKIASKFWSIATGDSDSTLFQANISMFIGLQCPALWTNGINGVQLYSTYAGTSNNGAPSNVGHTQGCFRFGSGTNNSSGSVRQCTVNILGGRTEDNNVAGTTPLATVTGSIAPNTDNATSVLTVTAGSGLAVGMVLTGTGIAAGTVVLANLTSTTWQVSQIQTVASTSLKSYLYSTPAIYIEDAIYESSIQGSFNTAGAGAFGGPGVHVNSTVNAYVSYSCFNNAGALQGGRFHFSGGINDGGIFDQTNSRGYAVGGRIGNSEAQVIAAYGSSMGQLTDLGSDYNNAFMPRLRADTRVFFGTGNTNTPVNFGLGWRGGCTIYNVSNYTGGSGLHVIGSQATFSPASLYFDSPSSQELGQTYGTYTLEGEFNSAWAAGGEMAFDLQQTPAGTLLSYRLMDATGIPAWGASTFWKLEIRFYGFIYGAPPNQLVANITFETCGTSPMRQGFTINLGSLGYSAQNGAPMTVIHSINNSGSNPLVPGCQGKWAAA